MIAPVETFNVRRSGFSVRGLVCRALAKSARTHAALALYTVLDAAADNGPVELTNTALADAIGKSESLARKSLKVLELLGVVELEHVATRAGQRRTVQVPCLLSAAVIARLEAMIAGTTVVERLTEPALTVAISSVDSGSESVDSGFGEALTVAISSVDSGSESVDSGSKSVDSGSKSVDSGSACLHARAKSSLKSYDINQKSASSIALTSSEALTNYRVNQKPKTESCEVERGLPYEHGVQSEMFGDPVKPPQVDLGRLAYSLLKIAEVERKVVADDKKVLRKRLAKFTPMQLCAAVRWAGELESWRATDAGGRPYLDLRTVCYSDQLVERLLAHEDVDPREARLDPKWADAVLHIYAEWKARSGFRKPILTDDRIRVIQLRLQEGFSEDELLAVVRNACADEFMRKKGYLDFANFMGSDTKVSNWLNRAPKGGKHEDCAPSTTPVTVLHEDVPTPKSAEQQAAEDDATQQNWLDAFNRPAEVFYEDPPELRAPRARSAREVV